MTAEYQREWRKRNKDRVNALAREWYRKNADKRKAQAKRYRDANPEVVFHTKRAVRLRARGLSVAGYDAMLAAQGGKCAICRQAPSDRYKKLTVDHDHSTGAVRGLLCQTCNKGLGLFFDCPTRLIAASNYIVKTKADRERRSECVA